MTIEPAADGSRRTERLLLRPPVREDLDAVFEIHGNAETNRFNPAGAHQGPEESERLLALWLEHWTEHGFGYWAVCPAGRSAEVLGFGGLRFKIFDKDRALNLYYRFRPAAWGRGYATELARHALEFAFSELGESAVMASVRPSNTPSIRVLERVGLQYERTVRDAAGESLIYRIEAPREKKQ